ncbi:pimelyl-ACP methyl ester esterase BioV [Helicobacter mehlei]|uniref:Pimelyl-ACP methyl ester esterase BioV n=1 Tax=Helicobacter mehlei TaxID=2316080 RepID=A0A553V3R2_9HELI|nr:pimelyl-ACP methyl ester esterase BioV [Helicobacter mehlei]TSA87024.1 pimelyl-ACP methyl ester esterase BioV [Helicobacter mehlei]
MVGRYFSGFGFQREEWLFESILKPCGLYDVAGFSYGAICALEYACEQVKQNKRIQRLVLIAPCMLAHKSQAFKNLQLKAYQQNPHAYMQAFFEKIGWSALLAQDPSLARYTHLGSLQDLQILLNYHYAPEKLEFLCARGVRLEVFIGLEDAIMDAKALCVFFRNYGCVWQFKGANHLLIKAKK